MTILQINVEKKCIDGMQWKIQLKESEKEKEVKENAPRLELLKKKRRGEKKVGENTP